MATSSGRLSASSHSQFSSSSLRDSSLPLGNDDLSATAVVYWKHCALHEAEINQQISRKKRKAE